MGAACPCLRNACTNVPNYMMAYLKSYLKYITSPVVTVKIQVNKISKGSSFAEMGTAHSSEMLLSIKLHCVVFQKTLPSIHLAVFLYNTDLCPRNTAFFRYAYWPLLGKICFITYFICSLSSHNKQSGTLWTPATKTHHSVTN
jgi:hypothetical protein